MTELAGRHPSILITVSNPTRRNESLFGIGPIVWKGGRYIPRGDHFIRESDDFGFGIFAPDEDPEYLEQKRRAQQAWTEFSLGALGVPWWPPASASAAQ